MQLVIRASESPGPLKGLLFGACAAILALPISAHFFPENNSLGAAALVALQLSAILALMLEENRLNIWEKKISPLQSNLLTACQFGGLFFGVLLAGFIASLIFPSVKLIDQSYSLRFTNELYPLIAHNLSVLLAAFLLSIVYQAGGLVMVLAWNAFYWAESFSSYFVLVTEKFEFAQGVVLICSLTPHLLLEAISYVLAGLAGIFFSKAILKYSIFSEKLQRVMVAVLSLLIVAVVVVALAGIFEVYLAQSVYHAMIASILHE